MLEQRAVVNFRQARVEVGRQGSHKFVTGNSCRRLAMDEGTDSLVLLLDGQREEVSIFLLRRNDVVTCTEIL